MFRIQIKGKSLISLLLAACMLCALSFGMVNASAAEVFEITIYHTNDAHGRVFADPNNSGMIGIDKIAAIKRDTPNSLLVDAGDAIHGLPVANLSKGENIIGLMKLAGYDVMVPGNHDFNYGSDRLSELASMAKESGGFDVISANIRKKADDSLFLPDVSVKEVNGVKVGFFGLTTTWTASSTNPVNIKGLAFTEYEAEARAAIARLRGQDADIIVTVAHISREESKALATKLGADIDVIIEGHDHISTNETVNGVLIASTGELGTNLGVVTLTVEGNAITQKKASLISKEDTEAVKPFKAVTDAASAMMDEISGLYQTVVGTSAQRFSSVRGDENTPGVRTAEMPLGNLVTDAMRAYFKTDLAIINGGGLRADIGVGDVTRGDVNAVLPFGNYGVVKKITPAQIKEMLENAVSGLPNPVGKFGQISGMSFVYDPDKPAGQRVVNVTVGDKKLDLTDTVTTYSIATNDYMANGGDGYAVLSGLETVMEGESLDVVLEEYIKELCKDGGSVTASDLGRITPVTKEASGNATEQPDKKPTDDVDDSKNNTPSETTKQPVKETPDEADNNKNNKLDDTSGNPKDKQYNKSVKSDDNPQTGDVGQTIPYGTVCLLSLAALSLAVNKKNRKKT